MSGDLQADVYQTLGEIKSTVGSIEKKVAEMHTGYGERMRAVEKKQNWLSGVVAAVIAGAGILFGTH